MEPPANPRSGRLLAFADLHGAGLALARDLVRELEPDWIVLLGDILPDFDTIAGRLARREAQTAFWQVYASNFERPGAVTTFIRGNHEVEGFTVPPLHRRVPSRFEGRVLCLEGIPTPEGGFGFLREMEPNELTAELHEQLRRVPDPTIVLSHAPPLQCLDGVPGGLRFGNPALRAWLDGTPSVRLVLCGHIHAARGQARLGGTLVLNLSQAYALLTLKEDEWVLERMEDMPALQARRRFLEEDL